METTTLLESTLLPFVNDGVALDEIKKTYIKLALHAYSNRAKVAKILGFSERTLYHKIHRLNLAAPNFHQQDPQESHRVKLGRMLRQARLKQGLKLIGVASELGAKSESCIYRFEMGKSIPKEKYLVRLSQLLSIPLQELKQAVQAAREESKERLHGHSV